MAKKSNTANVAVPKKKKTFVDICKENIGFFFILPWLFGFLVFKLWPMGSSLFYSFTDYNLFKGMNVIGTLQNYVNVFTTKKITTALTVTFKYAFITVPLKLIFALFIAYILNFKIKGVNFFRTGPSWLSDTKYSLFVICLLRVWQFGSAMIIFLAALKGVPQDLYEAASIDGAGKWRQFFSVTVPIITPVIFYNLVTQLCQAFQEFNGPYIITQGGPRNSTTLISLLIYNSAFKQYDMGMASAMAWVMFVILMIFTTIAFLSQKYWVFYSDEEG